MDIIMQTDMYYLCTHNNYTKRYTDSHAETRTYRQAIRQAHCRQSHTDICLERFTVLTDWLHATCVDYSKSKINYIYTEVISFFSVVIDTNRNQFMVNVDSSPLMLICLSLFCISSWVVGESRKESPSTLCLYIYIVSLKNHSVTRLCQFYVCVYSIKDMVFSKVNIYCQVSRSLQNCA